MTVAAASVAAGPAARAAAARPGAPEVSVAMATYNGSRFVVAQLRSILDQLRADDEVVVVDDASQDGTVESIAALDDSRVRLLRRNCNGGVRASFDCALRACRGRFLFLSDQDDLWLADKRATLVAELQRGALLALSDARVIDAVGAPVEDSFMARRGGFHGSAVATLIKNRYLGCTMAFRRELLEEVLPIPEDVPQHDMWIGALAALRGRVAYIDRPLMQYRRHGANVSPERRASIGQMLAWRWRLLSLVVARRVRGPRPVPLETLL